MDLPQAQSVRGFLYWQWRQWTGAAQGRGRRMHKSCQSSYKVRIVAELYHTSASYSYTLRKLNRQKPWKLNQP